MTATTARHTPGQLSARLRDLTLNAPTIEECEEIATMLDALERSDIAARRALTRAVTNNEANARLIAAAPTLVEWIAKRAKSGDTEARILLDSLDLSQPLGVE